MADLKRGAARERRRGLAPGDYVFLAFLTWGPATAYDIKKGMQASVSNFWSTAHSQVYQQAGRLLRDGYVKEQRLPRGARRKRLLSLTPKGRRAVTSWLRSPAAPPQLFMEALVKLFFAPQAGDLLATRRVIEQERDDTIRGLAGYEELYPRLAAQVDGRYPAMTLDLGIRIHRTVLEWANDSIAEIERDLGNHQLLQVPSGPASRRLPASLTSASGPEGPASRGRRGGA